jgi:hypothetical protein
MTQKQIELINNGIYWLKQYGKEKVLYPLLAASFFILSMLVAPLVYHLMG